MLNEYERELVKEMVSEAQKLRDQKDHEQAWERLTLLAAKLTEPPAPPADDCGLV